MRAFSRWSPALALAFMLGAVPLGGTTGPDDLSRLQDKARAEPRNAMAWAELGEAYYDKAQYQLAVEAYGRALALDPNSAPLLNMQGDSYRMLGKYDQAVACFRAALKENPKSVPALFNLSLVYSGPKKDNETALILLRRARACDPNPTQAALIENKIQALGGTKPFPARTEAVPQYAPQARSNNFPPAADAKLIGNTYIRFVPPPKMEVTAGSGDPGQVIRYAQSVNGQDGTPEEIYWAEVYVTPDSQKAVYGANDQAQVLKVLESAKSSDWAEFLSKEERSAEKSWRDADIMDAKVTMLKLDDMQSGPNSTQFSYILSIRNQLDTGKEVLVFAAMRVCFIKGKLLSLRVFTLFTSLKDHLWARQTLRQWQQSMEAAN